jgi:hypothetical protein
MEKLSSEPSHIDHIGCRASSENILLPNAAVHMLQAKLYLWRAKEPDFLKSQRTDDIPAMIRDVSASSDTL